MTTPNPDRFDEMLSDYNKLLPQLRSSYGGTNCPLTAEAVWSYFNTGKVIPARRAMKGFSIAQCGGPHQTVTPKTVRLLLLKSGHGTHGVVTMNPDVPNREHSANVVNIREKVYLVDAYNPQPVMTEDIAGFLKYSTKIEFTWSWNIHIVPDDRLQMFRCPVK